MKRLMSIVTLFWALLLVGTISVSAALGQEKRAAAWEYKAVPIGVDEKIATKLLNDLAAEGWELVDPLTDRLTAFKRRVLSAAEIAAQKELTKFQGEWQSGDQSLIIKGDRWRWGHTGQFTLEEFDASRFKIVETKDGTTSVDLLVEEGEQKGNVCRAIFRLEGDTLRYNGSYDVRPMGFDDFRGYMVEWKRAKK